MNAGTSTQSEKIRTLALLIIGMAAIFVVYIRQIPFEDRMLNFAPAGALFLFVGARLRPGVWYLLPFAVLSAIDLYFLIVHDWQPNPAVYCSYAIYLLIGWALLRRSENPGRIGLFTVAGSVQFFLITNFGVWLHQVINPELFIGQAWYYPPTFAGLMLCFEAGLPFFRGTILSDLIFSGSFFAAHAVLARAYFPAERIAPATNAEVRS
ncbi:MAG: hypothetical protein K8T89_21900 [Planctomycetes bacterium]|nr:hypothetical protein [Planctomycetota bacterium]